MPYTPFHYPLAYLLYKVGGKLSLPGLFVGAVVPDIEIPIMVLLFGFDVPNRMVLHSLFGSLTVGLVIALAVTMWIYPLLAVKVFHVDEFRVKAKCSFSLSLVFSCLIGVLSHVLLDVTNHEFNPVLWPFLQIYETPSPITPLFGGALPASIFVHLVMGVLFFGFFVKERERSWERFLVG